MLGHIQAGINLVALQPAQLTVIFIRTKQYYLNVAALAEVAQGAASFLTIGLVTLGGIDVGQAQFEFAVCVLKFDRITVIDAADNVALFRMAQGACQK